MNEKRRHNLRLREDLSAFAGETMPLGEALARIVEFLLYEDPVLPELEFLTSAQLQFLWWMYDSGTTPLPEASRHLCKSRIVAVRQTNRLARLGLIERIVCPLDDTASLRLTDSCRSLLARAEAHHRRRLQALWNALPTEKIAAVAHGLELLVRTVEAARLPETGKHYRRLVDPG